MNTRNKINLRGIVALFGVMICSGPTCSRTASHKELVKRLEKTLGLLKRKKLENKEFRTADSINNWDAVLKCNCKTYKNLGEQQLKKYTKMGADYIAQAREKGIKEPDIQQLVGLVETEKKRISKKMYSVLKRFL